MKRILNSVGPCVVALLMTVMLGACSSVPQGSSAAGPTRFTQAPEVLALEQRVGSDPAVRAVLSKKPGTRLKLLPQGEFLRAFIAQQREGKWFNITNQFAPEDLEKVSQALERVRGNWKAVPLQPAGPAPLL
ncbi:MAG: hypothetical protein ACOYMN_01330 [Roseimicrobium sp.]